MKILILGLNYEPEPVGVAVYTTGMARHLAARGHEVTVVCANPHYPAWRVMDGYRGWSATREPEGPLVLRCPVWTPASPGGAKRVAHGLSFVLSALLPALRRARADRPDVVMTIAPSLLSAIAGRIVARLCGARTWLHVQDLEVDAAFATGLLSRDGLLGRLARRFEARALRGFDQISAISAPMCRRLVEKGAPADRVVEFRNWADIAGVKPETAPSPYRSEFGIAAEHVALYSGNVAGKQGMELVLGAARLLAHRRDLVFVICGEGAGLPALRRQAEAEGLENVLFRPLQPRERLGELLSLASVHLLPQIAGAADLVLPSKLTNMLASGRPVVAAAAPGTGLAREVKGCGAAVPPGDPAAFAAAIAAIIDAPAERRARLAAAARRRCETRWAPAPILSDFETRLTAPA